MKIRGWQVEGFGVFCDYNVIDLPGKFVLVHGPNEAGKSTLLAFLRGVLFGFRGGEQPYPPLRGGRHGGALLLENPDGIYRIARQAGRRGSPAIVRPDGSEGGEDDLRRLLGGADRQLFNSVFAFSLQDLAGMDQLSSEQVRARIFSAGIAGAGRSAREVIDSLRKESVPLLSPKAGRIRELAREAQRLSGELEARMRRAAEYGDALRVEEEAFREVAQLRTELADAEARERRASVLLDLWGTEAERQQTTQQLGGLPPVDSFPAAPEERLAAVLGDFRAAQRSSEEADRALRQLVEQRQEIRLDDRLPDIAAAASDLAAECAVQRDRLKRTIELNGELREHESRIAEILRYLGNGWTEDRLASFDTSLPAAEEVRGWQGRVAAAKLDADKAANDLALLQQREAQVDESLRQVTAELEQEESLSEDGIRRVGGRLSAVADVIAEIQSGPQQLILDPNPLDNAALALAAAREECARLGTIASEKEARLANVVVAEMLVSLEEQVNECARHIEVERQRLHDVETLGSTLRERREALERGIRELGVDWTETRVRATPCDFARLQQLRELAAQLAAGRENLAGAERELEHVARGRSGREKDLQRLQEQLAAPEPPSNETLEMQSRSIRRLRGRLAELSGLETERRAEERIGADTAAGESVTAAASWLRWVPLSGWLVAAVLASLAAWRLLVHDSTAGALFGAGCLLTIFLVLLFRLIPGGARPSRKADEERQHRIGVTRRKIADLDRRAAEIRQTVADEARLLGLTGLPTLDQVEDRQEQWSGERDARRRRDDLAAETGRLGKELESWRESETRRKEECRQGAERAGESTRAWETWLAASGLTPGMPPDAARDLLQQVRALQERIAERDATEDRLRSEQSASYAWRVNAETILVRSGEAGGAGTATLFDRILELQRRCRDEAARARGRASLEQELADWRSKLAAAQATADFAQDEARSALRTACERVLTEWRSTAPARSAERKRLETIAGSFTSASDEWKTWQTSRGLERRMSPEGMLDFFSSVRRGREEIEKRNRVRDELDCVRTSISEWERHVAELMRTAGLPAGATAESWIEGAKTLAQLCATDKELRQKVQRLEDDTVTASRRFEDAEQEKAASTARLSALFVEAGVSDEQEFRERLSQFRKREALNQRLAELEAPIAMVLGSGPEAGRMRLELATGRVDRWTAERAQGASDAESLRERHEEAIRRHQDLASARRQLEEATDIPELELQLQAVREELCDAVRRFRIGSLAAALVSDTLRDFERTRQPAVLANASRVFGRVTDSRYPGIVQTEEVEEVVVLDANGARHAVATLSRGTQEQLYLSMRLGLAREFGQRAAPLPLVMDDVLVNFDEARAKRMALELMEFAGEQQVLLFTCHSFVRSMIVELDPAVCVIDLPVHEVATVNTGTSAGATQASPGQRLRSGRSPGL